MPWECFMFEMDVIETRRLRRYNSRSLTAGTGHFHQADVRIEDGPLRLTVPDEGGHRFYDGDPGPFMDDPRWPTACDCGYQFTPDDVYQAIGDAYYRAVDGRGKWPMSEVPIGGMLDCFWLPRSSKWTGPDGLALTVKLPPGGRYDWWHIDGPAANGGHWQRTGTPPLISVTPSIAAPGYHSFLGSSGVPAGWLGDPI